ncbi:patatin-like phospholipase family protein [Caulobacter vibrioides]|uniref:patatin-like phospholipase family protein n=1 Tax=Caulobacter vibrioides TaxID=155892 RepID=UPI001E3FC281|nr:patatin-like phospholipase family protein [Caulobacter vibrioides]
MTEPDPISAKGLWRGRRARLGAPGAVVAAPKGFDGVRLTFEQAEASIEAAADRLSIPRSAWAGGDFNILAISGGAAGGAFGAGVLVGLTRAGRRPDFALITGVSTGALIAPFAFLGPAWDHRLREAYTGGHAEDALGFTGLSLTLEGGLFQPAALERLVYPFIDDDLVAAVAVEHRRGRRLLVATTDLDRQAPCIWDMGEIACRGGPAATQMFRDVLIASASLPGLFPPRRFEVEAGGRRYEELHVDGGVSAPLFVMPEGLLHWRKLGRRMQHGRIYVIVNTVLNPASQATPISLPTILLRSFDTMLRVSYRQALSVAVTFSQANNLPLSVASIAETLAATEVGGMLTFETSAMRRTFDSAVEAAQAEDFWRTPVARSDPWSDFLDLFRR